MPLLSFAKIYILLESQKLLGCFGDRIYEKWLTVICKPLLCGERGIRTPGPVKINSFQDCRIRPLCHLSNMFPFVRECKGTNKIETSKLFLRFFFRREKFPLEKHQIYRSAGHAAVGEVEDCAEEGARIVHPGELIVK